MGMGAERYARFVTRCARMAEERREVPVPLPVPTCVCGHRTDAVGPHPCHSCRAPAAQRFWLDGRPFSLSGVQMKLSVSETWLCDACWSQVPAPVQEGTLRAY